MEWEAPAIVLDARRYGEADAIVTVIAEAEGSYRGLVHGGLARANAAIWQPGNFVQVRWTARLSEQLGSMRGELIHAVAAHVMDEPLGLATLCSACAVAEGALPEREPYVRVFEGLLRLLAQLPQEATPLTALVRWEAAVLTDLGYGLDLAACAVTGETAGLTYVSPRTGRAVTEAAAGAWTQRLLRLPSFLVGGNTAAPVDWQDGLRLTGHFLARDAFGLQHKPLPPARLMLYDRVAALVAEAAITPDDSTITKPETVTGPESATPTDTTATLDATRPRPRRRPRRNPGDGTDSPVKDPEENDAG